jgi:acylphosphatase
LNYYEIVVSGRVQGVGFRHFAVQRANELGVTGWVRNMPDDSVLIVACANEPVIKTFIDFLYIGPVRSHVSHISKTEIISSANFHNFSVKY